MITITDSAKKHIQHIAKNSNADTVIFGVQGGGCSGFMYIWNVANKSDLYQDSYEFYTITDDIFLAVDDISYSYVNDCEVDYVEDLTGSRLVVNNPHAVSSCGCGESITF